MSQLLIGNAALALGAYHAGCHIVSSYPGTPSTEITQFCAKHEGFYAEWAANEKVALEVAYGAAVAGGRALCCMKHVGLNVAADPLFTSSYTGIRAGLVIVVADDPGMHSSQNEQDSRYYARSAQIPMLEPADSQEAYDFIRQAFDLSEQYDTPILIRLTTRIAHGSGLVNTTEQAQSLTRNYKKDAAKYVMMPAQARGRHPIVLARVESLRHAPPELWKIDESQGKIGIITAGVDYQYVKEVAPDFPVFKVGMVYPLPLEEIRAFAAGLDRLLIIESLEPFIEETLLAAGIYCQGKCLTGNDWHDDACNGICNGVALTPRCGELSAPLVAKALGVDFPAAPSPAAVPVRPPVLCAGCPHRAAYHVINKLKLHVAGDIGCYTLGSLAPLNAMDTCLCMGGSASMGHGIFLANPELAKSWISVIGDSTFFHSGMTGLASAVYNNSQLKLVVLDNRTTGMTGHQGHPGTGERMVGERGPALDIAQIARAMQVPTVIETDPGDIKGFEAALKQCLAADGVAVLVARAPCLMLTRERKPAVTIDRAKCRNCGLCLKPGCPALEKTPEGPRVNASLCADCGLCAQLCPFDAISSNN